MYNFDLDTVREVLLTPNSAWGGEGSLGCGIGYGYLHRIPVRDEKSVAEAKAALLNSPSASNMSTTSSLASNMSTMVNPGSQASLLSSFMSQSSNSLVNNLATVSLNTPAIIPQAVPPQQQVLTNNQFQQQPDQSIGQAMGNS